MVIVGLLGLPLLDGPSVLLRDEEAKSFGHVTWVNRAIPDAELDEFVDDFARRIAKFDKRVLELGKQLVNSRAGIPSEADRWSSNHAFLEAVTWPTSQERAAKLMQAGLQKEGDFEYSMGRKLGDID
jgi:enoyl-CoA hydratase/carnithine racemase